jgi:hypothetical protein
MRSKAVRVIAATLMILASYLATAGGAVHLVLPDGSGTFSTIQQALAGADSGDVILLADGIYAGDENHNLDFLGKPLTLRSQSGNPSACIIECTSEPGDPDIPHRAFEFHNFEDSSAVVRDITIYNGSAGST